MCLGTPAKVIEIDGRNAIVDYGGVTKEVDAILMPNLEPGDYVIIHAGAIISRINEKRYNELVEALKELAKHSKATKNISEN